MAILSPDIDYEKNRRTINESYVSLRSLWEIWKFNLGHNGDLS